MGYQGSELDVRQQKELEGAFSLAENIVFKNYINHLKELEIVEPTSDFLENIDTSEMRIFKIDRMIYDKEENALSQSQKLTNVYRMAYAQNIDLCT